MQFLYPTFLYALFALAIPIIIHLFYFRRFRKVYFTNVRFLKEVKEETNSRQRLKNLLTLLMRLLAVAALVFAFAQPFIPQDNEVMKGAKSVSIFIDNSFSMSALSEDVPLVEKAKQRAREVVDAFQVEDRFQILTNDFEGRHQLLVGKEDALALIDEVAISPAVREVSKVLARQQQALNSGETDNKTAFLISDFQKNISDFDDFKDTTLEVNLVPLQSVQERNISIDSCWFDAPVQMMNQTNSLIISVKNHGDQDAENIRLSLRHDGQVKPVGTLSIPANASVLDTVNMTVQRTGWHEAELNITDYPVQFDDKYFFTFNVAEEIRILVINELSSNKYLDATFKGIEYFKLDNQPISNVNYSAFQNYHLIVTNGLNAVSSGMASELKQFVENGGNVLVFPGATADIAGYNSFLASLSANELGAFEPQERMVATINTDEFIFDDVFENQSTNLKLPVTQANYSLSKFASRNEEPLLTYRDGSTFLAKYKNRQGHLYLCTSPLDEDVNNLVRNGEIFIPMLYKMAISTAKEKQIAYTIGRDELIETDNSITVSDLVYKIKGVSKEFIPQQTVVGPKVLLGMKGQISQAGFYDVFLKEGEPLVKLAFNYDRKESEMAFLNKTDLQSIENDQIKLIDYTAAASLTPIIGERSHGIVLWRWCLILALIFLALETLLLRFWRV